MPLTTPQPPVRAAHEDRYRWVILVMAMLAVAGALGLGRFGYASVLPAMQKGLGLSNTQAGALASWNLVGYVALAVVSGLLSTRFGPRAVVSTGLVVAGVAMALTGTVHGLAGASAARALTGVGAGVCNVPAVAMMSTWFSPRRRGMASGFVVSGSSLALVVVGPAVPRLIDAVGANGWRVTWFAFGAVTVLLGVAAAFVLRDHPVLPAGDHLAPGPGVSLQGGRSARPRAPRPQRRASRADLGSILRSRYFWGLGAVYVAFGFSYMIYMTFFVRRLTGDLGMTSAEAGSLFMVLGWASLVCGVVWGFVSDVIGRKYALAIVCTVQAAAFALFGLSAGASGLTASALLFGLTAWSVPGIMGAAAGDGFGPLLASSALGFLTVFLGIGQAAGPLVGGALADAYGSFVPSYMLAAVIAVLGAAAALFIPEPTERRAVGSGDAVPAALTLPARDGGAE